MSSRQLAWVLALCYSLGLDGVIAEQGPFINNAAYLAGQYGPTPAEDYVTFNDTYVPRLHLGQWGSTCDDGNHYIFSTHGNSYIYDSRGYLVWSQVGSSDKANPRRQKALNVKTFRGKQYLAYFAGDTSIVGHGSGAWYMLDTSYQPVYTITGKNGITLDFHEFSVTEQGTAIVSAYALAPADLSKFGGAAQGQAWDSIFQEIDIETGELIFEWRASQHFSFSDMVVNSYSRADVAQTDGFDWFHINSVDKDQLGNYLISSRYASAVSYIDGRSGDVLWNLGGKHNNFSDISPIANSSLSFYCQHMPRWVDDYSAITLFDNGAYWGEKRRGARGLKIALNTDGGAMTSELLGWWQTPELQISEAEGSFTILPDSGNVFLGLGYQPVWAEFAPNGTMLCETTFAAQGAFKHDPISNMPLTTSSSYRTYKHKWVGRPVDVPGTALVGNELFASWNGATEVDAWQLETLSHARADELGMERWSVIAKTSKVSFETGLPCDGTAHTYRLKALDVMNNELGSWLLNGQGAVIQDLTSVTESPAQHNPLVSAFGFAFIVCGVLLLLSYFCKMSCLRLVRARISGRRSAESDDATDKSHLPILHRYSDSQGEEEHNLDDFERIAHSNLDRDETVLKAASSSDVKAKHS